MSSASSSEVIEIGHDLSSSSSSDKEHTPNLQKVIEFMFSTPASKT